MDTNYKKKYIKYKKKYIYLKNKIIIQSGGTDDFVVTSPDFKNNEYIPWKYAYNAQYPPTLRWYNPPKNTVSYALIMDDPDAPKGTFDHWILWNIDNTVSQLARNEYIVKGFKRGYNSFGKQLYRGPSPPPGKTHHYIFKLYALDDMLDVPDNIDKKNLMDTMKPHILSIAQLTGLFKKK